MYTYSISVEGLACYVISFNVSVVLKNLHEGFEVNPEDFEMYVKKLLTCLFDVLIKLSV